MMMQRHKADTHNLALHGPVFNIVQRVCFYSERMLLVEAGGALRLCGYGWQLVTKYRYQGLWDASACKRVGRVSRRGD